MERRLSAILAADMVGFSRLMEADEVGTLQRQKVHRTELIDPSFEEFHGRIVKEMGDGLLVEFPSVVEAVQCAVIIQREMTIREAEVSDDRRIQYRIGINLGDIIIEDDDIFGDGVNVAARLEQIAEPGGVCISGTAFDQLKSKVEVGYESLGDVQVKNIQQAVRAYKVLTDPDQVGILIVKEQKSLAISYRLVAIAAALLIAIIVGGRWWWSQQPDLEPADPTKFVLKLPERPSIAVLPFTNMSNDKDQDYFSDGMTEDLITDLSQISGLFVIARNSVDTYRGKAVKIQQVGRELGVAYVLEGSVRKVGDRVRINAQLIDAETGGHLWANRYDRKLSDVFALQDEVIGKIIEALTITLKPDEKARLNLSTQVHPEAYDTVLRGLEKLRRFTKETNLEARVFFEQAIALDPSFARAHADLALTYLVETEQHWSNDPDNSIQTALTIAEHALSLNDTVAQVYFVLANIYGHLKRQDDAIEASRKSIALHPNYADGYTILAISLNYAGKPAEGLTAIRQAMKLNPSKPFFYVWTEGQSRYLLGDYEEAAQLFEQVKTSNPEFSLAHKMLAATYIELDRTDDAEWAADELLITAPDFTIATEEARTPFKNKAVKSRYIENLRKAGIE